ncbi:hypothetical protein ACSNOF_02530 [Streptomyces sp. URMC 125]
MVANADPGVLASRGEALAKASTDLDGIGRELRTYVDRVEWKGEGADAFQEWGRHFALETMRFALYVRTLGRHMVDAGQALTETKAAIPNPEMCYADPEKDKARREAEEKQRQEAINQMNRLSSYYRAAGENLRGAEEPEFKPLPSGSHEGEPIAGTPGTATGAKTGEAATYRGQEASITAGDRPGSSHSGTETRLPPGIDRADRQTPAADTPTNMTIDSAATLPTNESRPQNTSPTPPQSSTISSTSPVAPGPTTSPVQRTGQTPSRIPVNSRSPIAGGSNIPPRGPGNNGFTGGAPRQPGAPAAGPGTAAPRGGTAVGGERAPAGRPMTGSPVGMGGGTPANRGTYPGRPMSPQPGAAGASPRAGSGRAPAAFTPGGTGLVRGGAAASGMAARPANTNTPPKDRRSGSERPDYLSEDEETWAARQRNVVPPVID